MQNIIKFLIKFLIIYIFTICQVQIPPLEFSVKFAGDCFVANAPRNDIAIIFTVISCPDARDKLREAVSDIAVSQRLSVLSLMGGERGC